MIDLHRWLDDATIQLDRAKAKAYDGISNNHYDNPKGNVPMMTQCKNPKCLRVWQNKVKNPKKCPYCQHYNNKPPKGRKALQSNAGAPESKAEAA